MQKRLVSLFAVALFVVGACGGGTATATPPASQSESPSATTGASPTESAGASPSGVDITTTTYKPTQPTKTGGTVVLAEWQFADTFNLYYVNAFTDDETAAAFEDGFLYLTNDLKYVPDLAKEVPTTDNGDVVVNGGNMDVTWKLKDGMQWSDGQPINCDDVTATWKWVMDKDNTGLSAGTTGFDQITGIDGAGTTTCVMHFKGIYEGYLTLFPAILPAHYIKTVPVKDAATKLYPLANPTAGVYSGPYIPTAVKTDAQITLMPNKNWKTISGHDPYLDSVIWKFYGDAESMVKGYQAGEVDVANDLNDADIPKLASVDQSQVIKHDSLTYELLAFNQDHFKKLFGGDYKTVIKAIKTAIDRQAIADGPLAGNVTPTNNFISPLTWYYKDEPAVAAADANAANTLLDGIGWAKGSDGFRAKGGVKMALDFCTTTRKVRGDTLALVASQLKPIGIQVNVLQKPATPDVFGGWNDAPATTKCNLSHGNYDVAEHAYISPLDPLGGYSVYVSTQNPDLGAHNGSNETRINLPDLDAAYNDVKNNVDLTKVRDAMFKVQDIYGSDTNTFELPLYLRKDVWLVSPKVQNFVGNPSTASAEWNIGDWWIQQ